MRSPEPDQGRSRGQRKIRVGVVTSNKMRKTIVVRVTQRIRHPKYHRVLARVSSFKAHDETNRAVIGDVVQIMETRPLSKEKRWRLTAILQRASSAPPMPEEGVLGLDRSAERTGQASMAGSIVREVSPEGGRLG